MHNSTMNALHFPMWLDQILVPLCVACAAAYLLLRRLRSKRGAACSGGCQCAKSGTAVQKPAR